MLMKLLQKEKMMKNNFNEAIGFILKAEGGFVNNKNDRGGMTYKGICRKNYPELKIWKAVDELLACNTLIKEMNKELSLYSDKEIRDVYYNNYWKPCNCDALKYPVDIIIFDTAINMGPERAKSFLEGTNDPVKILQKRVDRYNYIIEKDPTQECFRKGWYNRVKDLCDFCNVVKDYIDF